MKSIKDRKARTKWIAGIVSCVGIILIAMLAYSVWMIYETANKTYDPVERMPSDIRPEPDNHRSMQDNGNGDKQDENPPKTVETLLILGSDSRGSVDNGRTDAMILAILNEHTEKITLMSIPRDSYVEIAGQGKKDKINHAYRYGVETTIATVENLTGIPVDHYVLFGFTGFRKAVDILGGITVDVDESIARNSHRQFGDHIQFSPGRQLLNGREALYFSRFRYDADGDFGRNDRQQQVIKAFLDQSKEMRSPAKIKQILDVIGEDVRHDFPFNELVSMVLKMDEYSSQDVEQIKYQTQSKRMGPQNLWYELISEEEKTRVRELLREAYEGTK